jgi:predicted outer membrane repeat protein
LGLQGITISGGYFESGTAVLIYSGQSPEFDNCIFSNNLATGIGGALLSLEGRPRLTNCSFTNNSALKGGAIASVAFSSLQLEGCVFSGNTAQDGGGLFCENADSTSISNCTFAHNTAAVGSGLCILENTACPQIIDHSIFAFGSGAEAVHWDGHGTLGFSCVDIFGNDGGDWVGNISDQQQANGNMNLDPLFCGDANPGSPFSLTDASPCAADNNPGCGLIGALAVECAGMSGIEGTPLASDFLLHSCFPNPFNPATTLSFELKVESDVTIAIFDAQGRLVRSLVAGNYPAGEHRIIWRGTDDLGRTVGSGVYFAQLNSGKYSRVQKMALLR